MSMINNIIPVSIALVRSLKPQILRDQNLSGNWNKWDVETYKRKLGETITYYEFR